jgi:competence protein ComEC
VALLLPQSPPVTAVRVVAAVAAALACWPRLRWLAAAGCGFWLTSAQLQAALDDRLDPALEGQPLRIHGVVASVPQGSLQALRFRFAPEPGSMAGLPATLELTWYDAPARIRAAEALALEVKLRRPRGFANPGGQDHAARMLRDGIGASGYVRHGEQLNRRTTTWQQAPVLLARAAVADRILATLDGRPSAGIVAGLSVGLQDAVSREQWLVLSRSGTSHLMAISGLHIAMVAAVFAGLGGRLQRWRQQYGARGAQRDAAVIAGAVAALGYSLLAGWSVPTQRTMVMIAFGAMALLLRRRVGIADGLGLCVIAVLLLDPLAPLAPGFWLSFGAVAAILFGATGHVRAPGPLRGYLLVQAVVTLGLVPVLAGSFASISLVSALVNLYAIPLYTLLIVPTVLVASGVALVSATAGAWLLDWTGRLIELTWPLLAVPAAWPLATWSIAGLDAMAWGALLLGTCAVLAPLPWPGRVAGAALVVTACLWRPPSLEPGVARVTVLDVGQGLAVVVETTGHTLLYDAGPSFRTGSDTGQLVVVPYLRQRGLRALDLLVVSHDDDDHKGGAQSVLALLPTQKIVAGPSVPSWAFGTAAAEREQSSCRRGDAWTWDGVQFRWLHPGSEPHGRDNDSSCVLLVQAGAHTLLLTGDIEAGAERELLATATVPVVDVMIAPHHGSRTSSTDEFVEATRPRWVVYAVGYRNRWNFPVSRVVKRWASAGAEARSTSRSGALTFELRPGAELAAPQEWRLHQRRPWRDP